MAQYDTLLSRKLFPFKICQGQTKINMVDAAAAAATAAAAAVAAAAVSADRGRSHY